MTVDTLLWCVWPVRVWSCPRNFIFTCYWHMAERQPYYLLEFAYFWYLLWIPSACSFSLVKWWLYRAIMCIQTIYAPQGVSTYHLLRRINILCFILLSVFHFVWCIVKCPTNSTNYNHIFFRSEDNFSAFFWTWRFITTFSRVYHQSVSWFRLIWYMPSHHTSESCFYTFLLYDHE